MQILDFLILVFNTEKGYLYYIIPKKFITCTTIAFNPLSKSNSKYRDFEERWDFLLDNKQTNLDGLQDKEKKEVKIPRDKKNVKKKLLHDY